MIIMMIMKMVMITDHDDDDDDDDDCAFRYGLYDIVERLLQVKGISIDLAENDGWTPLFFAAFNNFPEVVKLLLEHGADRQHSSIEGYTIAQMLEDQQLPDVAAVFANSITAITDTTTSSSSK
jgi:ankyrin repeat protein